MTIKRLLVAFGMLAMLAGAARAQPMVAADPPKLYKPKQPPTRREMEQRDALHKYVEGLLHEIDEKAIDALKAFEESERLDPSETPPIKAQVPLLIAMNRLSDALAATERVRALDPGDFSICYTQAKLLRTLAKYPEAIAALEAGLKSPRLKDHPEAAQQMYLELGSQYEGLEKFGPAADAYSKAADILEHPDALMAKGPFPREAILARAAETHEKIGQLYRKAKRHDDALAALERAQKHDPAQAARISFIMAHVAKEQGNLKQALAFVDAYLRTQPLSTDPHEMKVELLRSLKQTDKIVPWLEEAAARERFNSALQMLLANELLAARQPKKAEAIYKKLAEENPTPEAYRGLFRVYKEEGPAGMARILGMLDKVIDRAKSDEVPASLGTVQHAKAMVGAVRDDTELATKLVESAFRQRAEQELKFDTVYFLAVLADRHRKADEAERFYRACLRDKNVGPKNEAILYSGLLRVLGRARKHDAVVEVCLDGLKSAKSTNPLLFYSDIARALAGQKKYDDALAYAAKGDEEAGDNNRLLFKLLRVRILSMADRFQQAEKECEQLLKKHDKPGDVVEVRYVLSNVYSAAKQHAKSEEQLKLILKIDPLNATANNDLGYLWADQGRNLEEAENMIRAALEADRLQRRRNPNLTADDDKDSAAYVDSLGWVLFRRGQVDEARKELERAASLDDSNDPVIYDHLGDVYARLKMNGEAVRAWQRALELYETGLRQKEDDRVRDIQRKLREASK